MAEHQEQDPKAPPSEGGSSGGSPPGPPVDPPQDPELDPELVRLPPPRPPRSPIVALAVLLIGTVLLVHLRTDIRYALSPTTPMELPEKVPPGMALPDNRLVAVRGIPDYRYALLLDPREDQYRRSFFRLLGTGDRLLVHADQTASRHELSERYVGRLRRFDALPYADEIRDYYARQQVTRFVDVGALRACLPKLLDCSTLRDATGEPLRLEPARPLLWVVDFPDELTITLSRDRFLVEEDARHELERMGQPLRGPGRETTDGYVYVVEVPAEKRDAYLTKLEPLKASFAVHRERLTVPLTGITTLGDTLALQPEGAKATTYPWSRIVSVQVEAPVRIPADSWVLLEGKMPWDYKWMPFLAGGLALFMLFNLWLIVRWLLARRAAA
ncbi:MAG TPA: hypothetical protein VH877_17415 [Polyangia bacterium]|jgi:hypothetical protein|nr:hypothetical protein [Polyangia bacterium]